MGVGRPQREYKYEGDTLYLKCTVCGEWKTKDMYYKYSSKPFGLTPRCKKCQKIYATSKKESISEYQMKYRIENKDKIAEQHKEHNEKRSNQLGFNRKTFHTKTLRYAKENKIIPNKCPICGSNKKIEMHHTSYDTFDKWCEVVFCCSECHHGIHAGFIKNPKVVNLKNLTYANNNNG